MLKKLEKAVLNGYKLSQKEALWLLDIPLEALSEAANRIRKHFMGSFFDLCTIINGKNGKCSEDCKFCAQSAHYSTDVNTYPLLSESEILPHANDMAQQGIRRYSIVTSGKKLNDDEIKSVAMIVKKLNQTKLKICGSFGLLDKSSLSILQKKGLRRYHNNLETNKDNFKNICTTHNYNDKVKTIKAAQSVGLEVCSGGLFGIGESMQDRIALAFELRALNIRSIPINAICPIIGTPFENYTPLTSDEIQRIVAIFRWINPVAVIRLAGGRNLLKDGGKACFMSGANGAITGDLLTTTGMTVTQDIKMIRTLRFSI